MLTLASASTTRARMLREAGIAFEIRPARVDEEAVKASLQLAGHGPRDVADALAELKALRVRVPGLVLGCDQVLDHDGAVLSKPAHREEAETRLLALAGGRHRLHAAAVLAEDGRPIWRHVDTVTLTMRHLSPTFVTDYIKRQWDAVRETPGAYLIEGESARLFSRIDGDHDAALGLPLKALVDVLVARGELAS